ncbi:hypothetical protein Agub_g8438 [Astrephomene gubernaculifera]|uniref:Glycosyltransferase 2-like domain-containing protein n=1 Tax=Astrephomene gubernaculifera TaxID=47775 RepID=A0AAD3HNG7_9CHLO|nr:hypothetical protein Agub_g8438 [Astrephomene gubernaculifera]
MGLIQLWMTMAVMSLTTVFTPSSAGPDHSPISFCRDLYKSMRREDRYAVRDIIQALHAVESYQGHLRLGRPLPRLLANMSTPSSADLEAWKVANSTKLQQLLDGTGALKRQGGSPSAAVSLAAACFSNRLHPDAFAGRPLVSVLLNYFKRAHMVSVMAAGLRNTTAYSGIPCELVVNVDNPHEADAWAAEVQSGLVVPVFSANLHESRGYNRAARAARGSYLVIWQDDQKMPIKTNWVPDMVRLYETYPQLGVLGMNTYRLCKHMEPTNLFMPLDLEADPKTGVQWNFIHAADFAPLGIRATTYRALGGLDEGSSRPGDCGIWGDWELCARAWADGWHVGFMYVPGRLGDGQPGGTHTGATAEKCWGRQQFVTMHVYNKRHDIQVFQNEVCDRIWLLNMLHFKVNGECPYGQPDKTRCFNCTALTPERAAAAAAEMEALGAALSHARASGAWGSTGEGWGAGPGLGGAFGVHGAGHEHSQAAAAAAANGASGAIEMNPRFVRVGGRRLQR